MAEVPVGTGSYTWQAWNQTWTTTGYIVPTATTTSSAVWRVWNAQWWPVGSSTSITVPVNVVTMQPPSSEEQRQRHAEFRARQAERASQQKLAQVTARSLLELVLDEQQLADYQQRHFFEVVAKSGRRYRILTNRGKAGNVRLMVGDEQAASFCAHLYGAEPTADSHIAQKLALEDDEEGFLAVANMSLYRPELCRDIPALSRASRLRATA